MGDNSTARGAHLSVLVLIVSIVVVLVFSYLDRHHLLPTFAAQAVALLTSCPYRHLTGVPCPLCGATTAAMLLLEGQVAQSVGLNPLAMITAPLLLIQGGYRGYRLYRTELSFREEALFLAVPLSVGWMLFTVLG